MHVEPIRVSDEAHVVPLESQEFVPGLKMYPAEVLQSVQREAEHWLQPVTESPISQVTQVEPLTRYPAEQARHPVGPQLVQET